jgi:flagellar biogenesis protein FliO
MGLLSAEVFEVLGRAAVNPRFSVQLVRCGNRLLLLAVTPEGVNTLTEITDAHEVAHVLALCRRSSPSAITENFRQIFEQITRNAEKAG